METADRNAIEGLFSRLATVERRSGPRDSEAEALIADELRHLPSAPYYLAQTVLVQEHALSVAERRIRELESELERRSQSEFRGGRLSGRGDVGQEEQWTPGPWGRGDRGGGFLAGAAQTALGVTSGILLGSAIAGMFGAGAANAAEAAPGPADEPPQDDGGGDDAGAGDFGDGGGFDFGGDF